MKAIILGDVHGEWDHANATVQDALKTHPDATHVFQVGDLGDGWPNGDGTFDRWVPDFDLPIIWIDGNHENFDLLDKMETNPRLIWKPRGSQYQLQHKNLCEPKQVLFFGGATSPDEMQRIIGVDWWPQESIKTDEVISVLVGPPIWALFCHDRPNAFPIPKEWTVYADRCGLSDRIGLEYIVARRKPNYVFHGHWHHPHDITAEYDGRKIRVISCPIVDEKLRWTAWDGITVWKNWNV